MEAKDLSSAQIEARRRNSLKSTGPRTPRGKRHSRRNSHKHGLYSDVRYFYWDAAVELGEDPREFQRLLAGLHDARQPADTLEQVVLEDIAVLIWKKARLERSESAVQVCNVHKHDLERRRQFIQVGREISTVPQEEVRENGVRATLDAPGKFEQALLILDCLMEMVERSDFSFVVEDYLRGLYGKHPTVRGAGLYNTYFKLRDMAPDHADFVNTRTLFRALVAEETSDVLQEYEQFLYEHVENTRSARMAAMVPSHDQWAAIIRQQNALHRQLEQKIRLLDEMQARRKKAAASDLLAAVAAVVAPRNPSTDPQDSGQSIPGGGSEPQPTAPCPSPTEEGSNLSNAASVAPPCQGPLAADQRCSGSSRRRHSQAPHVSPTRVAEFSSVQEAAARGKNKKSGERSEEVVENKGSRQNNVRKTSASRRTQSGQRSPKSGFMEGGKCLPIAPS